MIHYKIVNEKELLENKWHLQLYILERNFNIWYNDCERNNAYNSRQKIYEVVHMQ